VLAVTVIGVIFSSQTGELQSALTGSRPELNGPPPGFNGSQPGFNNSQPGSGGFQNTPGGSGQFPNGRRPDFGGFRSPLRLIHRLTAYLVALLLSIHILAALYHQFIRKDNLFARMWYGSR